jgi:general secretion pathway protein G
MVRTFKKSDDPTSASPLLRFSMSPRLRVTASPRPRVSLSRTAGFTLLELMIVITIVIILAAIALPQYQKSILAAREAVLREDLYNFRKLLDQYAADKGKLPQSLDELVSEHYMREMPVDPITGQADWTVVSGEDPNSTSGEQGVIDIKSSSGDTSSEGTPYSEW